MTNACKKIDQAIWNQYKTTQSDAQREQIILAYLPLVKKVAGRLAISLPKHIEIDDLVSYGILGLIDAIQKYDPQRGVKFETYALLRIKGAIMDELRAMDWVPASLRQKARLVEKTYMELETKYQRPVTDEELAEALNLSVRELHQLFQDMSCFTILSIDDNWQEEGTSEERLGKANAITSLLFAEPSSRVEYEELKETLANAIAKLPERERLVIALFYYEELSLKEISEVLKLSPARISQLHTKAVFRLRGSLGRMKKNII